MVVDEHYIEAADSYASVSAVNLVEVVPNVVVTRSLSKMYGLAGLRIGYVLATEEAIETLTQFRPPSPVGSMSSMSLLSDQNEIASRRPYGVERGLEDAKYQGLRQKKRGPPPELSVLAQELLTM